MFIKEQRTWKLLGFLSGCFGCEAERPHILRGGRRGKIGLQVKPHPKYFIVYIT